MTAIAVPGEPRGGRRPLDRLLSGHRYDADMKDSAGPQREETRPLVARDQVLSTLSHEIRTPLNGVLGMAGLLASTRLDDTQKAYLQALRDCGDHLLNLVNDVLDFAKLDAGRMELEPVETDVERLLQGVAELLSPRARETGIEIAWWTASDTPRLMTDDGRLRQILFNLAGNAVKFAETGGVLISAEVKSKAASQARLRFNVRDTGPGLDADAQTAVFGEFVQTEAGVRAGGAGLGLAIVKRLAEAFGGAVGVDSAPGAGATFWFEATFRTCGATNVGLPLKPLAGLTIGVVSPSLIIREAAARQIEGSGGRTLVSTTMKALPPGASVVLVDGALHRARPPKDLPALILLTRFSTSPEFSRFVTRGSVASKRVQRHTRPCPSFRIDHEHRSCQFGRCRAHGGSVHP